MLFAFITLITALALAATAAAFAVLGIMALFSGMATHAMIMGIVVEMGKVVGVSWIYRHWEDRTVLKYALIPGVLMAMLLTSMGVFALLSQAYVEQSSNLETNTVLIERLDARIAREQRVIQDAEGLIDQLDQTVNTLIEFNRISGPDGARAVREGQQAQRDELAELVRVTNANLDDMLDHRAQARLEIQALEREVGPVLFLAQLVYSSEEADIDRAVRWAIIAFIFVFDPTAILLLMAANHSLMSRGIYLERSAPKPEEEESQELSDHNDTEVTLTVESSPKPEPEITITVEPEPETPPSPEHEPEATQDPIFTQVTPLADESVNDFLYRLIDAHGDPVQWQYQDGSLVEPNGVIARDLEQADADQLICGARDLAQHSPRPDHVIGRLGKNIQLIMKRPKE